MKDGDIQTLLAIAQKAPYSSASKIPLPRGWDYKRLCLVVGYCYEKGLVKAEEVTNSNSPHEEYLLLGITAEGEDVFESSSPWNKFIHLLVKVPKAAYVLVLLLAALATLMTLVPKEVQEEIQHWVWKHLIDKWVHGP